MSLFSSVLSGSHHPSGTLQTNIYVTHYYFLANLDELHLADPGASTFLASSDLSFNT